MDPQVLANRLRKNQRHLGKWARREGIEAYRLYDRDIPEFPFAIDRYGQHLHVQVFERKLPLSDADLELLLATIAQALDVAPAQVAVKTRRRQRGLAQYEKLADDAATFTVAERGLKFEVNLHNYLDTGLFLDHRETRRMVGERAQGRTFLNLFAYTGSFTVYAAAGGAQHTVTVDMSNTYQDWSRRNLGLNGLNDPYRHTLVQADVLTYLDEMRAAQRRFELIVLDPPSFSNSKRMQASFDIQRDQLQLLRSTLALLAPAGELFFSTNRKGFKLDPALLEEAQIHELTPRTIPEDFQRHTPHRCWILSR